MLAKAKPERRELKGGKWVFAIWVVTFLGARLVLDRDLVLDQWIKIVAALVPIIPTAVFLWYAVFAVRELDELHRQVHLEALVIAFPMAMLLLMTLGLLQLAVELNMEDWSYRHVWMFLPMFYFFGLLISWRRYR
ncbi:MAG: hypothetical protein H7X80_00930 [bacterium]|nr:hypothetical protein [Candidatus Kapabacteria bacterium]